MTNEEIKKHQEKFREYCINNRLRYKLDEDREPIAPTRSKKNPKDHFFITYDGNVGVAIDRETARKYKFIRNKLILIGAKPMTEGDFEGNFSIKMDEQGVRLAKLLKIKKMALRDHYPGFKKMVTQK